MSIFLRAVFILFFLTLLNRPGLAQQVPMESKFGLGFSFLSGSPLATFIQGHWRFEPGASITISHSESQQGYYQAGANHFSEYTNTSLGATFGVYYQTELEKNFYLYAGPMLRASAVLTSQVDSQSRHASQINPGIAAKLGLEYLFLKHFSIAGEATETLTITGRTKYDYPTNYETYSSYSITAGSAIVARYYF
jgi:hypothetical protein